MLTRYLQDCFDHSARFRRATPSSLQRDSLLFTRLSLAPPIALDSGH